MGQSHSTNVANVISNVMEQVTSSITANQQLTGNQNQIISVTGVGGDVVISGNKMNQTANLNMDALAKQISSQTAQQDIVQRLSQQATAITSGINIFQSSDADNTMNAFLDVGMSVASNIGQICAASNNQNQAITVNAVAGNVSITDNQQDQVAGAFVKCMQDSSATNSAVQSVQQSVDQSAVAKSEGLDLWELIILLVVVGVIILLVIGMVAFGGASFIKKLFFPLLFLGGLAGAIYFGMQWQKSDIVKINGVGFSTLIKNDGQCQAMQYSTSTAYNNATDAGTACLNDPNCAAFDWIPPNTTIFYNKLGYTVEDSTTKMQVCPNVKAATLPPGTSFTVPPQLLQGKTSNNAPDASTGNTHDVYVDQTTGHYFWKVPLTNQWQDQGAFPSYTVGVSTLTSAARQPSTAADTSQLYIDTSDSNNWQLYVRTSTGWPATGTQLTSKTATSLTMSFPGLRSASPATNTYNWTGYKVHTKDDKQLWYVGAFATVGLIGLIATMHAFGSSSSSSSLSPKSDSSSKSESSFSLF